MLQVAVGDQVPLGMAAQPPIAEAQQLVYFIVADPVMLVVVQYRQQHIQVGQQVLEPGFRCEAHAEVWAGAPLRKARIERVSLNLNSVAERLKQALDEVRSVSGWYHCDAGFQRNADSASSGRSLLVPARALPNTDAIATLKWDDATYGRSFTYCSSQPPEVGAPGLGLTKPTGSIPRSSATVQRSRSASG